MTVIFRSCLSYRGNNKEADEKAYLGDEKTHFVEAQKPAEGWAFSYERGTPVSLHFVEAQKPARVQTRPASGSHPAEIIFLFRSSR